MSSAKHFNKDEILEQLDDLGAYRREVEAERAEAEPALSQARAAVQTSLKLAIDEGARFAELERELDTRLARIFQSAACWSHRAAIAGIPETEVLARLELARGQTIPEEWEFID